MPPGFYNPYDQQVYDAGFKYIPQSKYLLNPFTIPTDDSTTTPPNTGGITTLPTGGGGGGALQAGGINYDSFAKAGFDAYAKRQPTPLVNDLYQSKLDKTFMGFPSYKEQQLTGPDMGEYIASGTDVPLELTKAGKIQQGFENVGQGLSSLKDKFGGIGPISAILGSMDKFDTLPALDQQFIKQSMGYTGPTVFGENTGGGYVDPFGVNVRSAFGNYAEKVRDDFDKLTESLSPTGAIGSKKDFQGATYNAETGLFESDTLDQQTLDALNKRTKMVRTKLNFRKKQKLQQDFDAKTEAANIQNELAAAAAAKDKAAALAAIKKQGEMDYNSNIHGPTNYGQDSGGNQSFDSGQGFGIGSDGGPVSNRTGRGRTGYLSGGLADMLEIYDWL